MQGRDGVNDDGCNINMNSHEENSSSPHDEASIPAQHFREEHPQGTRKVVVLVQQHDKTHLPCPVRREALRLNHEAVNMFVSGTEEEEALSLLKLALSLMKGNLATGPGGTSTEEGRSTNTVVDHELSKERYFEGRLHSCCIFDLSSFLVPVSLSRDQNLMITEKDDSSCFFYSKMFTFQLSDNMEDNMDSNSTTPGCLASSIIDSESLCSIIIYNLAMLLAIRGIRTNSSVFLKKALALYKLSLGLLPHDPSKAHHWSMARSLAIVCWNNSGHIAFLLRDFAHLQTVRQMLQTLLTESFAALSVSVELDKSGSNPPQIIFDEVEIQGFKSNIMFMYPPNIAPVA